MGPQSTFYYRHGDGSYSKRVVTGEFTHPEDTVLITEGEHEAAVARITGEHAARVAEIRAVEDAELRTAYEELLALGVSETSARRMSGYVPVTEGV